MLLCTQLLQEIYPRVIVTLVNILRQVHILFSTIKQIPIQLTNLLTQHLSTYTSRIVPVQVLVTVLPFSSAYTSQRRLLCSSMSDEVGLNFILRSESIDPFFNICLNHTVLKTLVPKRSQTNVQICEISHLIETSTT